MMPATDTDPPPITKTGRFRESWDFWLALGLMLHTAGIFFCENGVIQNLWGAWLVGQTIWFRGAELRGDFRSTPWLRWVTAWMILQFVLGLVLVRDALDLKMFFLRGWDLAFLPCILALWVYALRRQPKLGLWTVCFVAFIGTVTAAISFAGFYSVEGRFPRARFMNQFVNWWWNDGFHPVLTGLTFAFAGICAMLIYLRGLPPRAPWLALVFQFIATFAALFSHSRGTLLALATGAGMAVIACWGRRLVPVLLVMTMTVGAYLWIYSSQRSSRAPLPGDSVMAPNASLLQRKDAGRFSLYRTLMDPMDSPVDWIAGRGLWAADGAGEEPFAAWAFHPHSLFFSTFFHHGIVGLALLGTLLGTAFLRALRLCRRGDPEWLVLLSFGCAGLLFDGHLLLSLTSIPRIEPLLVLFPMTVALTLGARSAKSFTNWNSQ